MSLLSRTVADLATQTTQRTVLVVDDEPLVLTFTCKVIARMGHAVVPATNGVEGIAQLTQRPEVALVIADLDMPEMTGAAMHAAMLDHPEWCKIPVVLITGGTGVGLPRGIIALRKPYEFQQIQCVVVAHLGGACPFKRTSSVADGASSIRFHLPMVHGNAPVYCEEHCRLCPKLLYT